MTMRPNICVRGSGSELSIQAKRLLEVMVTPTSVRFDQADEMYSVPLSPVMST